MPRTPAPAIAGLAPAAFLRRHWQKRSKLFRAALPGFAGPFSRNDLVALACRDDVESRLVVRARGRLAVEHGPFAPRRFASLPARGWTLLVQGTNLVDERADALMHRFDFLPFARLDDVMVSYAAPGGGVGPHLDAYDVFLLQGFGRRRWRWGRQTDTSFRPGLPLRILARFEPTHDAVLGSGDMLYLPPGVAHFGVSDEPCFTYSIGFLAPSHRELCQTFLGYLNEELAPEIDPDALYQDPDLQPQQSHLTLSDAMIDQVTTILEQVRWDRDRVGDFLGRLLTGRKLPKGDVAPSRTLSRLAFARRTKGPGRLTLSLASRGLLRGDCVFLNGEAHHVEPKTRALLTELLHARSLPLPLPLDDQALALLYDLHTAGYLLVS